jgi:Regulator of chromosome condensation (RCC1) repeat
MCDRRERSHQVLGRQLLRRARRRRYDASRRRGEHTCAILDDNRVKCWGYNSYGQLGLGDDVNSHGDGLGDTDSKQ